MYDVIVVGSGISGLTCAISAAEQGKRVCVISKEHDLAECNTFYAQGGIVADGMDDSHDMLARDIIKAGDALNYEKSVDLISREGPGIVREYLIDKVQVPFCRNEDGELDRTQEGAHSTRRILHVKDESGKAIENSLLAYTGSADGISFKTGHTVIDLITNSHHSTDVSKRYEETRVIGVYALDENEDRVISIFAPAVVLATGGLGNLFLHTTNPKGAVGDGIAMAYRAGATILNAEFVQFHPTKLYHRDEKRFLISESLRGEGARLMTRKGDYFMERYNPVLKDLAPRDEVARAIYHEIELEDDSFVLLDATRIKGISLEERFPAIYNTCYRNGIDITKEPIPVVPAAHYFCGGVKVDIDGRSNVPGLYVVGESACTGVQGANRLASVSLLEGLYFGIRTGRTIASEEAPLSEKVTATIPEWVYPGVEIDFDPILISQDLLNIRSTMWHYAGIIRTKKRLQRILNDLNYMSHRIEQFYKEARMQRSIIELRNAVLTASIIARGAYNNPRSIGCHYIQN